MSHNFGKKEGHIDEYNPSKQTNFLGKRYNIKPRNDITIAAYDKERDSYPTGYDLAQIKNPVVINNECD